MFMNSDFWNQRYSEEAYAYGEEPNEFIKQELAKLNPCSILFPAEGEGRNAVYAASLGFHISAFDQSAEGKRKALLLAEKHHVAIDYFVNETQLLPYATESFDAVAFIFAHFPADIKSSLNQKIASYVKSEGYLIFEAFSKKHISYREQNPSVGGPADLAMLYSIEELKNDFHDFEFLLLEEKEVCLNEGSFHSGVGSVIRAVARKKWNTN